MNRRSLSNALRVAGICAIVGSFFLPLQTGMALLGAGVFTGIISEFVGPL
jgi:hypothetical protein